MRKIIIIVIAIIVAIPVIIITGLYLFITPNQYKPMITKAFFDSTHRKLELNGDIKLKIFPYIGLEIDDAAIKNPEGFPDGNTVVINQVDVKVELKPLFSHQININSISIDGLAFNLISNGNLNNWQFGTQNTQNNNANKQPIGSNTQKPFKLTMKSFKITNSSISYNDLKTKKSYSLTNININLPDLDQQSLTMNNNQIVVNKLKFNINNIQNGQLNLILNNFDSNKISYSGNLEIPKFSLKTFSKYLNTSLPSIVNKKNFDDVSIYFNFFGNKEAINLNDLNIALGSTILTGNVAVLKKISEDNQQKDSVNSPTLFVSNNIKINKLDLSDFQSINGFKLPLENISIAGKIVIPTAKSNLSDQITLNQNIHVSRVTLLGASLRNSINQINGFTHIDLTNLQKLNPNHLVVNIQSAFSPFKSRGAKDLSKTTNLGEFYTNAQMHHGILSTPVVILNGPDLTSNANGIFKLKTKYMDYNATVQLKSGDKTDLINNLVFPIKIWGRTNNIQYKTDWTSILTQILNYQSKLLNNTPIKKSINSIKQGAENIFHNLFK